MRLSDAAATSRTVRVVVDTGAAGDEAIALLLALLRPEVRVEAVTVVCGAIQLDQAVENVLSTIAAAGREGAVPVFRGCARPLLGHWIGAEYVHGQDGMGDSFFPPPQQRPEAEHAVDALVRLVDEHPGELTIVAQAPLTNVAAAVVRDPELPRKVKELYVLGGGEGNVTPAAEFNFFADPEAAKIVLSAGFRTTLFTWTLARARGVLDAEQRARIEAGGSPARFFAQVNRKALEFFLAGGYAGSVHPASMLCAAIVDPSLVLAARDCVVDVETRGELTRGYSLVDGLGRMWQPPNARVVEDYDTDRFVELLSATFASAAARRGGPRSARAPSPSRTRRPGA